MTQKPLGILMISGSFYPKVDGSVVAVANLIRELSVRGNQVVLLTRGYGKQSEGSWEGVRVIRVNQRGFSLLFRILLVIDQVRAGYRILKITEVDVIHAHGFSSLLTAVVLKTFRRVPIVVTFHGLQRLWNKNWGAFWFLKFHFMLPFEGLLARRADLLVAQSAKLGDVIARLYRVRSDRVVVLPNPVDVASFHYTSPDPKSRTVLFVGTIGNIYGPDLLVKAATEVVRLIPDSNYIFVGEGPAKEQISHLATNLGLASRVSFVGRVTDRQRLEKYYASSRMLVVPFRGIGGYFLSLAALEAMAVGRPVLVAYESDPTPGVTHTSNDPRDMARQIVALMLMNEDDYVQLCRAARRSVEDFSSSIIASKLETSYQRISYN